MKEIQNRTDIEFLVDEFYKQILDDDLIGVFFTEVVQLKWEVHIPVMYDFWESTLLYTAKYKGNPMLKHIELNQKKALEAKHFDRWLEVWEDTIRLHFNGKTAEEAILKANSIGSLMQIKIKR